MKIEQKQLAKIHIAKKELGLTDDQYLILLDNYGVNSSKNLSYDNAEDLLQTLIKLGFNPVKAGSPKLEQRLGKPKQRKYDEFEARTQFTDFASPAQLRYLEFTWRKTARDKTDKALQNFIRNKAGVDHITFLTKNAASKLIYVVQKMNGVILETVK